MRAASYGSRGSADSPASSRMTMNDTWCQMSTRTTTRTRSRVAQPVDGADADQPEQIVHDPEHRVQEHAPDRADHHRVDAERQEQDEIVDVLAALDRCSISATVKPSRNSRIPTSDEAQRDPERVTELTP